jgi:hypothetical protein
MAITEAKASDVAIVAELGEGRPVLALADGFAGSPAHQALARRFRVTVLSADSGEALAAWIGAGGLDKVGLLASGPKAAVALAAAEAAGERIQSMVLVSPDGVIDASGEPPAVRRGGAAPKAVLIGSLDRSQPPGALSLYRKALAACHPVLVFGAGRDLAADRPEAFADVAGDFLDRQARFALSTESVALRGG